MPHCGTHLDAPSHLVDGGTSTAELDLSQLVLPGHLLDLRHTARGEAISPEDLEAAAAKTGREIGPGVATIVWTGADSYWGEEDYRIVPTCRRARRAGSSTAGSPCSAPT